MTRSTVDVELCASLWFVDCGGCCCCAAEVKWGCSACAVAGFELPAVAKE